MPDEQPLGVDGQLRREFQQDPGGQVVVQPLQRTIPLGYRERALACAAGKRRGDFDGREPARRDVSEPILSILADRAGHRGPVTSDWSERRQAATGRKCHGARRGQLEERRRQ